MIQIVDNFISFEECDELIKYYHKNEHNAFQYYRCFPLDITDKHTESNYILKKVSTKINSICLTEKNDQDFIFCYTFQLVKWNKFSYHYDHYDREHTKFSFILYLNDDYVGGNTIVEGEKRVRFKKKGSLLIIKDSDKILHSVQTILSGTRYTLAMWFED